MADTKEGAAKPAAADKARAEAQAKRVEIRKIINRINESKAKRQASRPQPRIKK